MISSMFGNAPAADPFELAPAQIDQYRQRLALSRKMLRHNGGRERLHTLVVEDQTFSRQLLLEVLHDTCSVATCTNAYDGWKIYVEEVPDIAFLDISLPGASGHMLADRIKELDPMSYVVMVTASQDVHDLQVAKGNRVDGFIVKPFNKKKILDCIARYQTTVKMPFPMKMPL